jgi:hypothetical protein
VFLGGSEPADDFTDRRPLLADPLEHLTYDTRLVEHDLEAGSTTAFFFLDVAVAVRRSR